MTKVALISDTHSFIDDAVLRHLQPCDEVWHAGDFGSMEVVDKLKAMKPLRGVWGNIDGPDIRAAFPETARWKCEDVEVLMAHIGGYPGKYAPQIKAELLARPPQLFICGHSHILKVMYDDKLKCLHMNPGAAGNAGWHKVRTIIRFVIDGKDIKQCEVIEMPKKIGN